MATVSAPTKTNNSMTTTATSRTYPAELLSRTLLFAGIKPDQIEDLLTCRGAKLQSFEKDQVIWRAGDPAKFLGIMCSGTSNVISIDRTGLRAIHASLTPGEPFGGSFVCAQVAQIPYSVVAVEPCTVLLLNYSAIITPCPSSCEAHHLLVKNMLLVLAEENLRLKGKMRIIAKRQMREKLLTYLEDESSRQGTRIFNIPFNRQELADYLGVERSALCAEISKMRKEGILESNRKQFCLNP